MLIEVFGAPGVGKSALCNSIWPPSVAWDGLDYQARWRPFLDCVSRIAGRIRPDGNAEHWLRMFRKAARKVATLSRRQDGIYAGVGLVMRGIDLGWRIDNPSDIAEYLRMMPLPDAAISLHADVETIEARNRKRGRANPRRALGHLAKHFEAPQALAVEILRDRGVEVLELDMRKTLTENRARLFAFAGVERAFAA